MFLDVLDLRNFYAQPLGGRVTAHHINQRVRQHWPNVNGLSILGVGYTLPIFAGCAAVPNARLLLCPLGRALSIGPPVVRR